MKKFLSVLFLLTAIISAQPKEEVRAVWLTTVFNLDWPPAGVTSINAQKDELIKIFNLLKAANFNTIMLQVRARGDLLYPSAIEPWAKALTGFLGQNPGYDPLQFAIEEAHKRGMELHAWWNVYKVYGTGIPPSTNPPHIVLRHPELCKLYANEWWLDPGIPEAKNYLLNLAMEMIRKYDIDATHFDFIRYPNPDFNDDVTYANYGGGVNKSDWRRNNITQFVSAIYDSIQNVKPRMKVGSAPIGTYKNIWGCTSVWEGFYDVYQDSRRWMYLKKHDYLSPQLYRDMSSCLRFDSLAIDWINNSNNRHIYPGIAVYRMSFSEGDWPASEILAQIDSSRKFGGKGQTYFRTQSFKDNQKNIYQLVKDNQYKYPANIPSMQWKDNVRPNPPQKLTLETLDSLNYILRWNRPTAASDGDTAYYYNVYKDIVNPPDVSDIKKVIKFQILSDTSVAISLSSRPTENTYFTVTAYDRGYNESEPAVPVGIIINSIADAEEIDGYVLYQNYPNPFNSSTVILYSIPVNNWVELTLYDVLGKRIRVFFKGFQFAGTHSISFSSDELPSGIYLYKLSAGGINSIRKMLVLK